MGAARTLAAAVVLLVHAAAYEIKPSTLNLDQLTCDRLQQMEQLDGCRFSVVNEQEQQIACKMLVKEREPDEAVKSYSKSMLNTMSFRLLERRSAEKNAFCASIASIHLQIRDSELLEEHTVADLPPFFISFLSYFTNDSFGHFNFTKQIPVAIVYLRPECQDLRREEFRDNCVEKVLFLREIKRGSFKLEFGSSEFWGFLKRRFVELLGAELTQLSLASSGQLLTVPPQFIASLLSSDLRMREMTVAKMNLGEIKDPLITMPTLTAMRLLDDGITRVSEAAFKNVPGLLELDLSGNELEGLPQSLPGPLVSLNVSRNKLANLYNNLPASLVALNVSDNGIEALPETLPLGLQSLDASHNQLRHLPQKLPAALRLLNINHNQLQVMPGNLPATLNFLQVSHNQLKTVDPQLLVPLQKVQVLDLSQNQLTTVDDMWLSHPLQLLNVSHNQLQHIRLSGPGNVTHIDASYNLIESWKVRAQLLNLERNPRSPLGLTSSRSEDLATIIDMGDNMLLDCDPCSADSEVSLQLRHWLLRQNNNTSFDGPRLIRPTRPVCTDPQEEAGKALTDAVDLEDSSGCPGSPRYVAQFVLLLISVLALIGAFAAVCYYRRYEITYILHLLRMRRERLAVERRHCSTYKYDAFVCYSSADRAWVVGQLLPKLEHAGDSPEEPALRLCLHERDFPLGSFITDNILSSMKNSRSTVIVLSQAFVDSQWCRWELELASSKVHHLLLLELERLERSRLPRNLRYLMDTRTYVEWPTQPRAQAATWKKLRAALTKPAPSDTPSADVENHQNGDVTTSPV